jgi:hypothetical protein
MHTDIYASIGVRTHDPSVPAGKSGHEDISLCLIKHHATKIYRELISVQDKYEI